MFRTDSLFHSLSVSADFEALTLNDPFNYQPHELICLAAEEVQNHIQHQGVWKHNFGIGGYAEGRAIGKMFGVMLVSNDENKLGYLAAFSGKLANGNHHAGFVPPVFDSLEEDGFLNLGMTELTNINNQIKALRSENKVHLKPKIEALLKLRKNNSTALQRKLFEHYNFINRKKEYKNLYQIFPKIQPPGGAGECAAPKLLQYAFLNDLKPLQLGEFWWGNSEKSDFRNHLQFYPACEDKCRPILKHMLEGFRLD